MTKAPDGGSMSLQEPKEIHAVERPAMKAMDKSIIRPNEAQHKNIFSVENVDFYYGEKCTSVAQSKRVPQRANDHDH